MALDRHEFFDIMAALPTGVAIVTALDGDGRPRGLTTSAVTSVSADPPILLVCVDLESRTLPALKHSRRFVVNFMHSNCEDLCRVFASKAEEKFDGVSWRPGLGGMPVLHEHALAWAECATRDELVVGDHIVFTGLVEAGAAPDPSQLPIVYFRKTFMSGPRTTQVALPASP